ncbi:hypothetical protein RclHR1_03080011 [Rhizophagus clarus]|uniref:Uncharacterized protein n=1 Tax=Rhizophagus clarus TaxID=94130 RepID=A0A2Z6R9W2_9GLOM|nr:hypothetical protein RclHR1_03080011 [Rhizophagus clarus]
MSDLEIINISSDLLEIQYSLGKPSGAHSSIYCPFLGVKCKDERKTCQGVKLCSIATPDLINTTYTMVNPDIDLSLRNPRISSAIKTKCCHNDYKANRSNTNQYFIGCSLYTFGTQHRYIRGKPNVDENLLTELFKNEGQISTIEVVHLENKNVITIPHVKDGKIDILPLVKTGCNVIFHKYEPLDLNSYPYIVMVRVFGEINEVEFNAYDEDNNSKFLQMEIILKLINACLQLFFEVYEDLIGEKPSFYHFDNSERKGWTVIIVDLDKVQAKSCLIHLERNIKNSKYSDKNKFLMCQLPKTKTKDNEDFIFEQLTAIDDEKINDWIAKYQMPWILSSLNCNYLLMDYNIWMTTPFDTNVSECSHENINREGIRLRLKIAIFHSWNYDLTLYKRFHNHQQYNILMSSKNKSGRKKKIDANKRKVVFNNIFINLNLILIIYLLLSLEKRKSAQILKLQNKRQKVDIKEDEFQKRIQELEFEECKEELERKRLDNHLKKLEIVRREKELNECNIMNLLQIAC